MLKTTPTFIKRGDIYLADLNPMYGSKQGRLQPVLVIQNYVGNTHSPAVIVVPMTSNPKYKFLPMNVDIKLTILAFDLYVDKTQFKDMRNRK